MAANKKTNKDAIPVRSYQELHQYVQAFSAGHLNLLIILGGPGLAKSQTVRQSVASNACWLEGNATAFGIYTRLYHYRDAPVIIDDVDSLYTDKAAVRLLKCLCQTDEVKNVAWNSGATGLQKENIPKNFETKMLLNSSDGESYRRRYLGASLC